MIRRDQLRHQAGIRSICWINSHAESSPRQADSAPVGKRSPNQRSRVYRPRFLGHRIDAYASLSERLKLSLAIEPEREICTACGFWDTGLKPTLLERAVEAAVCDID